MPVRIFSCQWAAILTYYDYQIISLSDFLFTLVRTDLLIPTHLLYVEWQVNSTKVIISLKLLLVTVDVDSAHCTQDTTSQLCFKNVRMLNSSNKHYCTGAKENLIAKRCSRNLKSEGCLNKASSTDINTIGQTAPLEFWRHWYTRTAFRLISD